jgi:subtilisin family serine protease
LRALGALGVAVVTSAGNDATTRPMFPAAFAPHPQGLVRRNEPGVLPIVSVGALNPDGSIAMFSNEGPWVRVHRPGAALVSTLPVTFDASRAPSLETTYRGEVRATIDPDDFSSGFGTWSGTSFAAPILAGEIAEWLNASSRLRADTVSAESALDLGWDALRNFVPRLRRPT